MKKKLSQVPLLIQDTPILSDDMPSPEKPEGDQSKQQSKGWRTRLFGGGKKKNKEQKQKRQPEEHAIFHQHESFLQTIDSTNSMPSAVDATFSHSDASSASASSSKGEWPKQQQQLLLQQKLGNDAHNIHHSANFQGGVRKQRQFQREDRRDDCTASTNTTNQVIEELQQSEHELLPGKQLNARARTSSSKKSSSSSKLLSSKTSSSSSSSSSHLLLQTEQPLESRTRSSLSKSLSLSTSSMTSFNKPTSSGTTATTTGTTTVASTAIYADPVSERTRSSSTNNSNSNSASSKKSNNSSNNNSSNSNNNKSNSNSMHLRPPRLDAAMAKLTAPSVDSSASSSSVSTITPTAGEGGVHAPDWDGAASSPTPRLSKAESTLTVKALLSRPFGRENLNDTYQMWVIKVSSAEWEPEERLWKYRIVVHKRVTIDKKERLQEITNGFTFRSLIDFYWLEQSLTKEFHGGLLLPGLAITLGVPDLENTQHEVDSTSLTHWLSDVLNGVRGQGELLLSHHKVDLISSESIEAFLYRNASPLNNKPLDVTGLMTPKPPGLTDLDSPVTEDIEDLKDEKDTVWTRIPDLICAGCQPGSPKHRGMTLPLNIVNCSSRALGDAAAFEVKNSFVEGEAPLDQLCSSLIRNLDLLEAEKELAWGWRTRALSAMEKMRVVTEHERHIGSAWKRLAISLSNLFAYEKDVESARFGDSKPKRELQMPYKKLQKSAVDDCLRVLARQKVERGSPSIEALEAMLNAYVADLSSVSPSVDAYIEGVKNWGVACKKHVTSVADRKKEERKKNQPSTLAEQFKAGLEQVKKLAAGKTVDEEVAIAKKVELDEQEREQQLKAVELKIIKNEMLLRESLTSVCKAAHVRTARLAYRYFNIEAMQCAMLHSAAATMKNKITIATKDTLSKMARQHEIEAREDFSTELQIVQRMVNVGNAKRFLNDGTNQEGGVEIDTDVQDEEVQKAILRDKALDQCRERIGRWDAKLALSILEAAGVHDADVRVEETTRDLRMIRKYAIGLRENLQRCVEALDMLKTTIFHGSSGDIRHLRAELIGDMQYLFSTAYMPAAQSGEDSKHRKAASPSLYALQNAGISLNDPSGWRRQDKGSCGGPVTSYIDARDYGTHLLLDSMSEMLKEYFLRVESVESFVYMDCVGIQLEKHFSQSRATALAAFEKKTDITSAINIATRKRMPLLVTELQAKLEAVGADVSHTTVKEAKEAHLDSKTLKGELHDLAVRRLGRARETSTERAIALMALWSKEEESAASVELQILKDIIRTMEMSINRDAVDSYLGILK